MPSNTTRSPALDSWVYHSVRTCGRRSRRTRARSDSSSYPSAGTGLRTITRTRRSDLPPRPISKPVLCHCARKKLAASRASTSQSCSATNFRVLCNRYSRCCTHFRPIESITTFNDLREGSGGHVTRFPPLPSIVPALRRRWKRFGNSPRMRDPDCGAQAYIVRFRRASVGDETALSETQVHVCRSSIRSLLFSTNLTASFVSIPDGRR